MDEYSCIYCDFRSQLFCSTIEHMVTSHPDKNLKLRVRNETEKGVRFHSKNFNVIANELKKQKKYIVPLEEHKKIKISRIPEASPIRKCQTMGTDQERKDFECETNSDDLCSYFKVMDLELLKKTAAVQTDPCIVIDTSSLQESDCELPIEGREDEFL